MKSLLIRQRPDPDEVPQIIQYNSDVDLSNMLQSKMLLGSIHQATGMMVWNFYRQGFRSVVIDGVPVFEVTEIVKDESPSTDLIATEL